MEEQQKSIDDIFRRALGDYREAPPPATWHRVVERLEEDNRRRRGLGWRWVALCLLCLIGATWFMAARYNAQRDVRIASREEGSISHMSTPGYNQSNSNTTLTEGKPVETNDNATVETNSAASDRGGSNASAPSLPTAKTNIATPVAGPQTASRSLALNPATTSPISAANKVAAPAIPVQSVPATVSVAAQPVNSVRVHSEATPVPAKELSKLREVVAARAVSATAGISNATAVSRPVAEAQPLTANTSVSPTSTASTLATAPSTRTRYEDYATLHPSAQIGLATLANAGVALQHPGGIQVANSTKVSAPAPIQPEPPVAGISISHAAQMSNPAAQPPVPNSSLQAPWPAVTAPIGADAPLPVSVQSGNNSASVPASKPSADAPAAPAPDFRNPVRYMPFSVSVLAGYALSFNSPLQGQLNTALRFAYQVGPSLAFGIQPTYRFGNIASTTLRGAKSYQSTTLTVDSFNSLAQSPSIIWTMDTLRHYVIRQTYDSIAVSGVTAGGSFWEAEVPMIITYKDQNSGVYVYGGPSVNFGGRINTSTESVQVYTYKQYDSLVQSEAAPSKSFENYFGHKSNLDQYKNHKPYDASVNKPAPVRLGYQVGVGYEWNRVLLDASLRQQLTGFSNVSDELRPVYSSPTVRFNVGYRLFGTKK